MSYQTVADIMFSCAYSPDDEVILYTFSIYDTVSSFSRMFLRLVAQRNRFEPISTYLQTKHAQKDGTLQQDQTQYNRKAELLERFTTTGITTPEEKIS